MAYIIDSDDFVAPNYLEVLHQMIVEKGVKLSILCPIQVDEKEYETFTFSESNQIKMHCCNDEEGMKRLLIREPYGTAAWGKLYHHELFNGIRFPKGRLYEDLLTVPYLLAKCDKIAFTETKLYGYVTRIGSITQSKLTEKNYQSLDGLEEISKYINKKYPSLCKAMDCRYIRDMITIIIVRLVEQDDYLPKIRELKNNYHSLWLRGLTNPYLTNKRKIHLLLLLVNVRWYRVVCKQAMRNKVGKK